MTQVHYRHHMERLGLNGSYFQNVRPPLSCFYIILEAQKACKILGNVNHTPWDELLLSVFSFTKIFCFFFNIIINMLCPLSGIQTSWKIEVQQCSQCKTNKNLFAGLACLTGLSCRSSLDSNLYNSQKLSWIQNCLGHIYLSLILQSAGFFLTSIHKIFNHNNNNKKGNFIHEENKCHNFTIHTCNILVTSLKGAHTLLWNPIQTSSKSDIYL